MLRLPALITASILSLYAALWLFGHISLAALTLKAGLIPFAVAVLFLFFAIAAVSGVAQGWRTRRSPRAWGEASLGIILMLGVILFDYLMNIVGSL